jgi:hypothetical protein
MKIQYFITALGRSYLSHWCKISPEGRQKFHKCLLSLTIKFQRNTAIQRPYKRQLFRPFRLYILLQLMRQYKLLWQYIRWHNFYFHALTYLFIDVSKWRTNFLMHILNVLISDINRLNFINVFVNFVSVNLRTSNTTCTSYYLNIRMNTENKSFILFLNNGSIILYLLW